MSFGYEPPRDCVTTMTGAWSELQVTIGDSAIAHLRGKTDQES